MTAKHFDPTTNLAADENESSASVDQDDESVDLVEFMEGYTIPERRRIYALKHLYRKVKEVQRRVQESLAVLEVEKQKETRVLEEQRQEIVLGKRDVTEEEVAKLPPLSIPADDGSPRKEEKKKGVKTVSPEEQKEKKDLEEAAENPHGGIPNFWLTCLSHSDAVAESIKPHDRPILSYLQNLTTGYIDEDPMKGMKALFTFDESNPYLETANGPLTLTFHMELDDDEGMMVVSRLEGCEIGWKSDKLNPTIRFEKRKQRNKKTREMRVVERKVPQESFFSIFSSTPSDKEDETGKAKNGDDEDEEDEDDLKQKDLNIEIGQSIIEDIIPKAVLYYSWQIMSPLEVFLQSLDDDVETEEEEEEEEEEESEEEEVKRKGKKGAGAKKGDEMQSDSAGAGRKVPDCKQQ